MNESIEALFISAVVLSITGGTFLGAIIALLRRVFV